MFALAYVAAMKYGIPFVHVSDTIDATVPPSCDTTDETSSTELCVVQMQLVATVALTVRVEVADPA